MSGLISDAEIETFYKNVSTHSTFQKLASKLEDRMRSAEEALRFYADYDGECSRDIDTRADWYEKSPRPIPKD